MTREEKQKAIDALKISAPVMAVTQEEFKNYIQTLNKIMDWLEQETVSKEVYDHEYFLRKEFELKIDKLQRQLEEQAIEQEPTTKNNLAVDCISRQATINAVKRIHPVDTDYDCTLYDKVDVMYVLDEMPSVTPQEPRKGHWINHREYCEMNNLIPSGLGSYFWCSNCECGIDASEWVRNNYNYCPKCGARMVEPQESEG